MRRFLLRAILACLGLTSARADEPAPPPVTDPALVAQHYREVLAHPQYQETEEPPLNSRFTEWLSDWFKRLGAEFGDFKYASRMPAFESLLMTLLVVFCVALLLYIMARLTRRRAHFEMEPTESPAGAPVFREPEYYDGEIAQAVHAGDWHAAWLASWRQFLSRLEHRHLVEPDRTRTNREYLAQLRGKPLPDSAFALLAGMVDAYDRFIYGRQSIGEPEWNSFHGQINQAVLILHLDSRQAPGAANGGAR